MFHRHLSPSNDTDVVSIPLEERGLWLAMGVIVTRLVPPFRRQTRGLGAVAWRYISTRDEHRADPKYVVVPCPDFFYANVSKVAKTTMGFQFSCFCKTAYWFRRALLLFPQVRFLGKMEDDSVLFDARVLAELIASHRMVRRESKREAATRVRDPMLWYGHFDWAVHQIGDMSAARFCGVGDYSMLTHAPACGRGRDVLAPFANGGLDIRSRSLAEVAAGCELVWEYVRDYSKENKSYGGSCDGLQGFFLARCIAGNGPLPPELASRGRRAAREVDPVDPMHDAAKTITALHLPWPKFHPPSRGTGARKHSSLIHPDKRCMVARGSGFRNAAAAAAASCDPAVSSWSWHEGAALLPFPFRLDPATRSDGSPMLRWSAWNSTHIRRYNQLHIHREDDRYCDELPCGGIVRNRLRATPLRNEK
uniref:Uncharacterized protein n=1 Tax=Haptolina ericina TaxID=156174 RepID=A0A7S3AX27_9EUKA|mmetsp:Transcript_40394/g.91553  ORF Transcript_40394/g.91553 Transcript_40394/m.91553 type:complete len:421 (+) Transcript_40394:75-1337(+)